MSGAGRRMTVGIEEWVRLLGQVVWLERRCFEVLGGWVAAETDPAAKLLLGRQYAHHAFHAELVERVLPELRPGAAGEAVRPPGEAAERFFDALSASSGPGETVERLTGAYRVLLPRKIAAYETLRASTTPVAEAPVARVLRLVLVDEADDLAEGEAALLTLLSGEGGAASAARASGRQGTLEALLAPSGLLVARPG